MRARGSKPRVVAAIRVAMTSRPMRARGSKQREVRLLNANALVAPHAGAWIETRLQRRWARPTPVAPHAGAWIETALPCNPESAKPSRPMRARGSKQVISIQIGSLNGRAPCGRVDRNYAVCPPTVDPNGGRAPCGRVDRNRSIRANIDRLKAVAPHAGAWIETMQGGRS